MYPNTELQCVGNKAADRGSAIYSVSVGLRDVVALFFITTMSWAQGSGRRYLFSSITLHPILVMPFVVPH